MIMSFSIKANVYYVHNETEATPRSNDTIRPVIGLARAGGEPAHLKGRAKKGGKKRPLENSQDMEQRVSDFVKSGCLDRGIALVTEVIHAGDFRSAERLCMHLHASVEWDDTELLPELYAVLSTLSQRGADALGGKFYAWIRFVLTYHLEYQSADLVDISRVIRGYQDAARYGNQEASYNLAIAYGTQGDAEKAIEAWRQCLTLYRGDQDAIAEINWNMGCLLEQNAATANEAAECYRSAIQGGNFRAALNLAGMTERGEIGQDLTLQNRREETIRLYQQAIQCDDQQIVADASHNLGVIFAKGWTGALHADDTGVEFVRIDEAEALFQTGLTLDSQDPDRVKMLAALTLANLK